MEQHEYKKGDRVRTLQRCGLQFDKANGIIVRPGTVGEVLDLLPGGSLLVAFEMGAVVLQLPIPAASAGPVQG